MADQVPFRIPDQWDAAWFRRLYAEVLSQGGSTTVIQGGGGVTQGDVNQSIYGHDADPFSHQNAFDAHKAENNPHGQYRLPVGSIFITAGDTNPATLLGYGTWLLRSQGLTLTGASEAVVASASKLMTEDGSNLLTEDGFLLLTEDV